ncbi:FAD-dependent oxidoreductase [Candidatus Poribacteria bacterium]
MNADMNSNMNSLIIEKSIPIGQSYDLVVCGGGPAGVPAALAAGRAGLKVLLVERTGQLGGVAVSCGVSVFLGYRSGDKKRWVGGIFEEIVQALIATGGAVDPLTFREEKYPPFGWYPGLARGIPFEPSAAAVLMDEKVRAAGVDVLLFTSFVDVVKAEDLVTHIVIHNKSGLQAVPAKAVVDATGDADVAARAGCEVVKGREEDGLMTPATLIFFVDRVDRDELSSYIYRHKSPRFRELIRSLREKGEWTFPYEIFISFQVMDDDVFMINTLRLCDVDGTEADSLTRGMMAGRQEVQELFALMKEYFPGFANARIRWVAPMIGVRETRRIVGDYVLTIDDIVSGITFPDTIGFSVYGWDLPDPKKPSYQPMSGKKIARKNPFTPIPYRVMTPRPVKNIICPGRAVSVQRHVLGPLRVMAPCFAMGEAAGLAAVQVTEKGIPFREIDIQQLQERLKENGAILDEDSARS